MWRCGQNRSCGSKPGKMGRHRCKLLDARRQINRHFKDSLVGAGEGKPPQLTSGQPPRAIGREFGGVTEIGAKSLERYPVPRYRVLDRAERVHPGRCNAQELLRRFAPVRFSQRNFHVRKLPQMRVNNSLWPLPHKEPAPSLHHQSDESARGGPRPGTPARQLADSASPKRRTETDDRAGTAPGLPRRADHSAELHQRLVEQ